MPEFTPEQKAEMSEAYTRIHGNGGGTASDVRGIPVYNLETGKPATAEELADWVERVTGTKHDADKPDAGTVLAGFWPVARLKLDLTDGFVVFREAGFSAGVLDRLFDTTVSISKRLTDALWLLPFSSLELTFRPGTFGARKKYGPDCWLRVTDGVNRYYQAAGRHAFKMLSGERVDPEGLVHSECLVWCIWAGATHVLRNEQERLDNMGPM